MVSDGTHNRPASLHSRVPQVNRDGPSQAVNGFSGTIVWPGPPTVRASCAWTTQAPRPSILFLYWMHYLFLVDSPDVGSAATGWWIHFPSLGFRSFHLFQDLVMYAIRRFESHWRLIYLLPPRTGCLDTFIFMDYQSLWQSPFLHSLIFDVIYLLLHYTTSLLILIWSFAIFFLPFYLFERGLNIPPKTCQTDVSGRYLVDEWV